MNEIVLLLLFGVAALGLAAAALLIRRKNMHVWLPAYIKRRAPTGRRDPGKPRHVFIAVCDHWEPLSHGASEAEAVAKVDRWVSEYPRRYGAIADSRGRPPQHTFFYPSDEYRPAHIDRIAALCRGGFGDVEIHLHHDKDTPEGFEEKLVTFRDTLHDRHGLLRRDPKTGRLTYGFIHGNWSLCNSLPDGTLCGVDHELTILKKTGCYADFTLPSAPSAAQTRIINSIYYAKDLPGQRKSHDAGIHSQAGRPPPDDHLLMIQGPLLLDWKQARCGILPRIENGDVTVGRAMSAARFAHWLRADIHVHGRPDWQFVKLHSHGCKDGNIDAWLGEDMLPFHRHLQKMADDDSTFRYHYVTAWEMAQLVHQAETGVVAPNICSNSRPEAAE